MTTTVTTVVTGSCRSCDWFPPANDALAPGKHVARTGHTVDVTVTRTMVMSAANEVAERIAEAHDARTP